MKPSKLSRAMMTGKFLLQALSLFDTSFKAVLMGEWAIILIMLTFLKMLLDTHIYIVSRWFLSLSKLVMSVFLFGILAVILGPHRRFFPILV